MKPVVDYRKFRLSKINTPEFSHVKYLLFWIIFGLMFLTVERLWIRGSYTVIHCKIDDVIPFCEVFLIPYMLWFAFLVLPLAYTLFYDIEAFKKMMRFIIISFTISMVTYMIFPNCQHLRPSQFPRDNFLTRFMASFYQFDTNTNVCPSLHVVGSVAGLIGIWNSKNLKTPLWRGISIVMTVLISLSTMFLKQHSAVDVIAAIPVCLIAYFLDRFVFSYENKKAALQDADNVSAQKNCNLQDKITDKG